MQNSERIYIKLLTVAASRWWACRAYAEDRTLGTSIMFAFFTISMYYFSFFFFIVFFPLPYIPSPLNPTLLSTSVSPSYFWLDPSTPNHTPHLPQMFSIYESVSILLVSSLSMYYFYLKKN